MWGITLKGIPLKGDISIAIVLLGLLRVNALSVSCDRPELVLLHDHQPKYSARQKIMKSSNVLIWKYSLLLKSYLVHDEEPLKRNMCVCVCVCVF